MTNIIKFPMQSVRDWALIEGAVREILTEANASRQMVDEICASQRIHWEKYNNIQLTFQAEIPGEIGRGTTEIVHELIRQGVENMVSQIHNLTNEVLLDLLKKEIELWILRRNHPDAG